MNVADLIFAGLELLVIGMGTVFVFLALLVVAVSLMSRLAKRFDVVVPAAPVQWSSTSSKIPEKHIAAIAAGIARYRAGKHK